MSKNGMVSMDGFVIKAARGCDAGLTGKIGAASKVGLKNATSFANKEYYGAMSRPSTRISDRLSSHQVRSKLHAWLLIFGAVVMTVTDLGLGISADMFEGADKYQHFQGGRIIAAIVFLLIYASIIARVMLCRQGSMTKALLWIPAFIALGLLAAILVVFLFAVGKELIDAGGAGMVEWADIEESLKGALSMGPVVGLIMAFTPFLIPIDTLMQIPGIIRADIRTGIPTMDDYLKESHPHQKGRTPAEVLLVEDDIACATVALNFCRNVGLRCEHVSSVQDAEEFLQIYSKTVKLIMLDNFVRLGKDGSNITGSEWLKILNGKYPRESRGFFVALISGHVNMLPDAENDADIVLQKPWRPRTLADFLRERGVLTIRDKT